MKDLNGSPLTTSATANNDQDISQTPPVQGSVATPPQLNGHAEQSASLQTARPSLKASSMSYQGVDLTAEVGDTSTSISWQ